MDPRLLTRFGDRFFAFHKPSGMAVHPNNENSPDLVSWIKSNKSYPRDLRPAHRLDKPTSGVVLCGAGKKARSEISTWMASEDCSKHYIALVAGEPKQAEFQLNHPLKDSRRGRDLPAHTHCRVLHSNQGFSLVELELKTGRKHQLRRHLSHAGFPIVGDERYGPKRPRRIPKFPNRLWLHAWQLNLPNRQIVAPLPLSLSEHLSHLEMSLPKST